MAVKYDLLTKELEKMRIYNSTLENGESKKKSGIHICTYIYMYTYRCQFTYYIYICLYVYIYVKYDVLTKELEKMRIYNSTLENGESKKKSGIHICTYIYMYTYRCQFTYYIYICLYVYTYIFIYIHIYIYIYYKYMYIYL
jgi:chromate transport protein ChrA